MQPFVATLSPLSCRPPHKVTHPEKMDDLYDAFQKLGGWDPTRPRLIGYPNGRAIQLLTGSHRWAAALRAHILIPVSIVPLEAVKDAYGDLDKWAAILDLAN